MTTPALAFVRYDMSDAGSAAALFVSAASVCGIYVLEFADGQRYVGQTTNITKRYAAHRRHHGDVVAFSFASCSPDMLDEHERKQVREEEARHSLRNLNLTGWPGGIEDRATTSKDGRSVLLPWERSRRVRLADEGSATKPARFWELTRRPDYEQLADALARYVDETIADPFATQEFLWTLSAMPTTNRTKLARRPLTMNCGQLEVLYVAESLGDETGMSICVNVDAPTFDELVGDREVPAVFAEGYDAPYKSAQVTQYVFSSWSEMAEALAFAPFVAAAYKLNTAMMRRGAAPTRKHHNASFASDVLRRAANLTHPSA